jgi:hypothetical protein
MPEMIEVQIDSVRVHLMTPQRLVVLKQMDSERYLPIWVGPYEAEAITVALQEVEMVRPLTHDLLKNVFASFNARIERVEISALKSDIFYGNIIAEVDGKVINIDSRPSDAIALAIRAHVPILVGRAVMDAAGITPEPDIQDQTPPPADEELTPSTPAAEGDERLSIFEDFLKKLDDEDHPDKEN